MKKTVLARILLFIILLSVTLVSCDMDEGAIDFDRLENEIKDAVSTYDSYPHSERVPADTERNWNTDTTSPSGNGGTGTGTGGYPDNGSSNEYDFQGMNFVFLSRNVAGHAEALFSEGDGSTILSEAVYFRQTTVEQRYNIHLEFLIASDSELTNRIQTSSLAGEFEYDVAGIRGNNMVTLATNSMLEDWNKMDCIDLSSSWWYESARKDLAMPNGALYAMDGDITYNSLESAGVMFFNEDILSNYGINNIYEMVANGTWTMEAFLNMVKNTNSHQGYVTSKAQAPMLAARSTGRSVIRNGGQYVFNWNTEKTMSFMDDFLSALNLVTVETSGSNAVRDIFADGNVAFSDNNLGKINTMNDINFSLGMAPWPKADANDEYTASVSASTTLYSIPTSTEARTKIASIIIDGFAEEGQSILLKKYYYPQVLIRYSTTSNMYDCAVLVHKFLSYDIGVMGNFSNISQLPVSAYSSGSFSAEVASKQSQIDSYLLKLNTQFK